MAIKEIIKMGHPLLLEKAKPITKFDTPELHKLVEDMIETMEGASGAGLAAPQIGVNKSVAVIKPSVFGIDNPDPSSYNESYMVVINPVLENTGDDVKWKEAFEIESSRKKGRINIYKTFEPQGTRNEFRIIFVHSSSKQGDDEGRRRGKIDKAIAQLEELSSKLNA